MWKMTLGQVFPVQVSTPSALVEMDWCCMICELANETGLLHMPVLHTVKECLGMRKTASWWVPHTLAHTHLEYYECKGEAFLHHINTHWMRHEQDHISQKWKTNIMSGIVTGHHADQNFVRTPPMWRLCMYGYSHVGLCWCNPDSCCHCTVLP